MSYISPLDQRLGSYTRNDPLVINGNATASSGFNGSINYGGNYFSGGNALNYVGGSNSANGSYFYYSSNILVSGYGATGISMRSKAIFEFSHSSGTNDQYCNLFFFITQNIGSISSGRLGTYGIGCSVNVNTGVYTARVNDGTTEYSSTNIPGESNYFGSRIVMAWDGNTTLSLYRTLLATSTPSIYAKPTLLTTVSIPSQIANTNFGTAYLGAYWTGAGSGVGSVVNNVFATYY